MALMRLFRVLIVSEIVLAILAAVVSEMTEHLLPEPLRSYKQSAGAMVTTEMYLVLAVTALMLVGLVIASIGMFFFWRPARSIYLACILVSLGLGPLLPPSVDAGYGEVLDELSSMVAGAVVALAWFSPLAQVFERKRGEPPPLERQVEGAE